MTFAEDGTAQARIRRTSSTGPQLLSCEFAPAGDKRPLRELVDEAGRCTTLMPSGEYQLMLIEAPDVEAGELRAAVRWRIKDLIDFHVDDAVIDVVEIPGQDRGRTRMMYAVAARAGAVRARIDQIEAAGLPLEAIDIEELALRNIAALLGEDARGVALLWFGPDYGLILVTRDGELYLSRRIEVGVSQLFAAAHQGDPDHGDYGEPLTALLDQVTLETQRSLDYYESHFGQAPVQALYVAPCAPEMPFIAHYLDSNLNLGAATLQLERLFPASTLPDPLTQARCLTAIGAALRHEEVGL